MEPMTSIKIHAPTFVITEPLAPAKAMVDSDSDEDFATLRKSKGLSLNSLLTASSEEKSD